jgi:hypothetical protein
VCLCVCLSVRLYVSTVLNGSSPSLEGNLLRIMTRSVGYILCVCTQRARVRVLCARINRVRMLHATNYRQRFIYRHCVLNGHVYSKRSNGFSPNMLGTYYYSPSVLRTTYFSCSRTVRTRACVLSARVCVHSLIFERIMSKFAGNILRLTISGKDYVLFIFTHRARACVRAKRARMCAFAYF